MCRSRIAVLCLTLALAMLQLPLLMAQSKPTVAPDAPVPGQILSAKKIFIANAGGDEQSAQLFSGEPDRAYNQLYAALKAWGRFQIVGSPSEADLLLEIRQNASPVPQFRLKLRDPGTNALLWGFNLYIDLGMGRANSDRNFDQAVDRLVNDLRALVARAQPVAAGGVTP
jgi:hypothetical protein